MSPEIQNFIAMGKPLPIPTGGSVARVSLSVWLRNRIRKLLKDENFDVIHIHEPFAGAVTLGALLPSDSRKNVVRIATFHSYGGSQLYKIVAKRILRIYSDRLDGRIAVSKVAKEFINNYLPDNYEVIPNGVNVDTFRDVDGFSNLRDGKTNILFLSRLENRKGLRYLLMAYCDLKWKYPNLRLIVVGSGDLDSESSRILGERNPQDVMLVGGVSEEDKRRYYKSADIFCAPATGQESFGIVLLEAMSSGIPIVASEIKGFSQVVNNEKNALLCTPKDVGDLTKTLTRLIEDPQLRMRLSGCGWDTAQTYQWSVVSEKVLDYYRKILNIDMTKMSYV
jgi:phosphatidylinositol alpha-mannosyltransferase